MIINDERDHTSNTFGKLKFGDVFEIGGELYLKIKNGERNDIYINAIELIGFSSCRIGLEEEVTHINSVLTLNNGAEDK